MPPAITYFTLKHIINFILTPYYSDNLLALLNTYNNNTNQDSDNILEQLSIGNNLEKKLLIILDNSNSKFYWKTVTNQTP